jgi:hypothetical protein
VAKNCVEEGERKVEEERYTWRPHEKDSVQLKLEVGNEEWLPLPNNNLVGSSDLKQDMVVSVDDHSEFQMVVETLNHRERVLLW